MRIANQICQRIINGQEYVFFRIVYVRPRIDNFGKCFPVNAE